MWGPICRAGERSFVPEQPQQSHDPDTPSLCPGWRWLCMIPRNSRICSPPPLPWRAAPWPPRVSFPDGMSAPEGADAMAPCMGNLAGLLFSSGGQNTTPRHALLLPTARCFGVSVEKQSCREHDCHSFLQQYNRDGDWEAAF